MIVPLDNITMLQLLHEFQSRTKKICTLDDFSHEKKQVPIIYPEEAADK